MDIRDTEPFSGESRDLPPLAESSEDMQAMSLNADERLPLELPGLDLPGLEATVLPSVLYMRYHIRPNITEKFREELIRILSGYVGALPDPEVIDRMYEEQKDSLVGARQLLVPSDFNGSRYRVSGDFHDWCSGFDLSLPHAPSVVFSTWFKVVRRKVGQVAGKNRYTRVGVTPIKPYQDHEDALVFTRFLLADLLQELKNSVRVLDESLIQSLEDSFVRFAGSVESLPSEQLGFESPVKGQSLQTLVRQLEQRNAHLEAENEALRKELLELRGANYASSRRRVGDGWGRVVRR